MQIRRSEHNSNKSDTPYVRPYPETTGDIISLFKKPIQKVGEKVFEELFDAKGKSKGFKEVFKDFKME